MPFKVLVVDNELEDLEVTRLVLSTDTDFEIQTEVDPAKAIELVRKNPHSFACVLLDYHMPKDGLTTKGSSTGSTLVPFSSKYPRS